MTRSEAVTLLDAFVRYAYNVSMEDFKALFPGAADGYLREKYKRMQDNLGAFFGDLDHEHRLRLMELIALRYAEKECKTIPIEDLDG